MIENTSKRDPLLHLAAMWGEGQAGYIEGMEAQGQRELVHSDRLPTDCRTSDEELRELGFVLGEADPSDPMFRPVSLPEGWKREGSGHSMWSYLVDGNGKRRASIFYKAAFYDRSAHMSLNGVHSYVQDLLYDKDALPELDGWATREAVLAAVATIREREVESAKFWADRGDDHGYVKESQQKVARLDVIEKAVTG